jgi:hypothetical protein
VERTWVSMNTHWGWWKAPIMFLPRGWFTPVLPPTEESTIAITVVGILSYCVQKVQSEL